MKNKEHANKTKNTTNVNEQRIRRNSNTPQQQPRTTHREQGQEQTIKHKCHQTKTTIISTYKNKNKEHGSNEHKNKGQRARTRSKSETTNKGKGTRSTTKPKDTEQSY
jgi:hypothetical protein